MTSHSSRSPRWLQTLGLIVAFVTIAPLPLSAEVVTRTFIFSASNFFPIVAPYQRVSGSFTVTWDNNLSYNNNTSVIQLNSLNIPLSSQLGFTYLPAFNQINIGGISGQAGGLITGTNDFSLQFNSITGNLSNVFRYIVPGGYAGDYSALIFNLSGVGSGAGSSADNPVLPGNPAACSSPVLSLCFPAPSAGWHDPPATDGFAYSLSSGRFELVGAPPSTMGFGAVDVYVQGIKRGSIAPGGLFDFISQGLGNVSTFELRGITPLIDVGSPGFNAAFPTYLDFSGNPEWLTMTPILASQAIPEPGTFWMLALGVVVACSLRLREIGLIVPR